MLTLSLDPDVLTLITGTPLDLSITTVRSVPRLPNERRLKFKLRNKNPNQKKKNSLVTNPACRQVMAANAVVPTASPTSQPATWLCGPRALWGPRLLIILIFTLLSTSIFTLFGIIFPVSFIIPLQVCRSINSTRRHRSALEQVSRETHQPQLDSCDGHMCRGSPSWHPQADQDCTGWPSCLPNSLGRDWSQEIICTSWSTSWRVRGWGWGAWPPPGRTVPVAGAGLLFFPLTLSFVRGFLPSRFIFRLKKRIKWRIPLFPKMVTSLEENGHLLSPLRSFFHGALFCEDG